jgi:hypothetical protein
MDEKKTFREWQKQSNMPLDPQFWEGGEYDTDDEITKDTYFQTVGLILSFFYLFYECLL